MSQTQTPPQSVDFLKLHAALAVCAPRLNFEAWKPAISAAFSKFDFTTPQRVAAAMGQFLVEAGVDFSETVENLYYSTPTRLLYVFPHEIPDLATATAYVDNAKALGNYVYAGRNGNGDVASGDGYLFRGRGLIQVTGRANYTKLAAALDMKLEDLPVYCQTKEGAAMSGCWYLVENGFLPLADAWNLPAITRTVNGPAMEGAAERATYAGYILKALTVPA